MSAKARTSVNSAKSLKSRKSTRDLKNQTNPEPVKTSTHLTEVDRELYSIRIRDLEDKLSKSIEEQKSCENEAREAKSRLGKVLKDSDDVIRFLQKTIKERDDERQELVERLHGLQINFTKCCTYWCNAFLLNKRNVWSQCGACPAGTRTNSTDACVPCNDTPSLYSWLYLAFMVITGVLLHWVAIDYFSAERKLGWKTLVLHLSAFLETTLAAVVALLISEPVGSLSLRSCPVEQLSDWYTPLHNPNPNYEEILHCSYEAVYPLYSIVFIHYGLLLVLLLLVRPLVNRSLRVNGKSGSRPIYAAMYFIPILAVLHAIMAGLIYYAFPSIVILLSVMSHAYHFASRKNQAWFELISATLSSGRNLLIVLGHWLLHIFGLVALIVWTDLDLPAVLLILVPPLPTILYVAMVRFTDPEKLHLD
nr:EOG090X0BGA [Eulimnadia texana]